MYASLADHDGLDRTAFRLLFTYGGEAAVVAYIKAVHAESRERLREARNWRGVLGRIAAIDAALHPDAARVAAGSAAAIAHGESCTGRT